MNLKELKRKLSKMLNLNLFDAKYSQAELDELLSTALDETESDSDNEQGESETPPTIGDGDNADIKADVVGESEPLPEPTTPEATVPLNEEVGDKDNDGDVDDVDKHIVNAHSGDPNGGIPNDSGDTAQAELFDAKLEAALLRANVREDKLESAKRLFKTDHTLGDIASITQWVQEYPEWLKTNKANGDFGMNVGENYNGMTAEERRAREIGLIK